MTGVQTCALPIFPSHDKECSMSFTCTECFHEIEFEQLGDTVMEIGHSDSCCDYERTFDYYIGKNIETVK